MKYNWNNFWKTYS